MLSDEDRAAWCGLVGQQLPREFKSDSNGWVQMGYQYYDGYQTPKLMQPAAVFVTPCLFWFNMDIEQSFLSGAIPYGQRFVQIDVAAPAQMVDKVA